MDTTLQGMIANQKKKIDEAFDNTLFDKEVISIMIPLDKFLEERDNIKYTVGDFIEKQNLEIKESKKIAMEAFIETEKELYKMSEDKTKTTEEFLVYAIFMLDGLLNLYQIISSKHQLQQRYLVLFATYKN